MNTVYQLQQSLYPSNIPFQVLIKVICIVQKVLIDLASRASLLVAFQNIVTIRTLHYVLQILIYLWYELKSPRLILDHNQRSIRINSQNAYKIRFADWLFVFLLSLWVLQSHTYQ